MAKNVTVLSESLTNIKIKKKWLYLHSSNGFDTFIIYTVHLTSHWNEGQKWSVYRELQGKYVNLNHSFIRSLILTAFPSVVNLFIHSFILSPSQPLIHLLTYSILHSFIQIFVDLSCICPSCIPSFIHSPICPLNQFSIHMQSQLRRKVLMRWCNIKVTTARGLQITIISTIH